MAPVRQDIVAHREPHAIRSLTLHGRQPNAPRVEATVTTPPGAMQPTRSAPDAVVRSAAFPLVNAVLARARKPGKQSLRALNALPRSLSATLRPSPGGRSIVASVLPRSR